MRSGPAVGWGVRWTLALLSSLLQVLCFPNGAWMPHGLGRLAWLALMPLYAAFFLRGREAVRPRDFALLGYVSAFFYLGANCYWIMPCMHRFGDLNLALAAVALVVYSAVLACWYGLSALCLGVIAQRSRRLALLSAPFLWVTAELLRSRVNGIPWDYLGQSQVDAQVALWLAPMTGVLGLSFVVAALNVTPLLIAEWIDKPAAPDSGGVRVSGLRGRWRLSALGFGMSFVFLLFSAANLAGPETGDHAALMLQPNESLGGEAWIRNGYSGQMKLYGQWLTNEQNLAPKVAGPDTLVVWPESPAPLRESDPRFRAAVAGFARQYGAPMVIGNNAIGAVQAEPGMAPVRAYYNSASFIMPAGEFAGRYDKIHLVPFGEYVPYNNLLVFLHNLTQETGDLTAGTERKVFRWDGHAYGVFICYESVFPSEVREFARNGAEVLVNISDDGWYGDSSAPWQHLEQTQMRAIENHRWILLDGNNGVTASIDPEGRIAAQIPRNVSTSVRVPFGFETGATFYTRHGDWLAWLCGILGLLMTLAARFVPRRVTA